MVTGLIIFLASSLAAPVWAQDRDGGTDIKRFREIAGAYDLRVAVVQSTLSLGMTLFAITVLEAGTEEPVPDARVVLRPKHEHGHAQGIATAHNTVHTPDRYDAQVNLESPGLWVVTVEVDSSLGRVAADLVELEVPEARKVSGGTFVFFGAFAVILGGAAYLWWSTKRRQRRGAGNG